MTGLSSSGDAEAGVPGVPGAPPPSPAYRQRPKAIGYETAYRLDGDSLVVDTTHRVDTIRLAAVEEMRFGYEPHNFAWHCFRTTLKMTGGRKLSFTNLSWKGLADCARQDGAYRDFVLALVAAVTTANPACRLIGGKPPFIWWLLAVVAALVAAGLLAFIVRAAATGQINAALIGVAVAGLSVWQLAPILRRNWPRRIAPRAIPPEVLP